MTSPPVGGMGVSLAGVLRWKEQVPLSPKIQGGSLLPGALRAGPRPTPPCALAAHHTPSSSSPGPLLTLHTVHSEDMDAWVSLPFD